VLCIQAVAALVVAHITALTQRGLVGLAAVQTVAQQAVQEFLHRLTLVAVAVAVVAIQLGKVLLVEPVVLVAQVLW
jgi:hypothetical protein